MSHHIHHMGTLLLTTLDPCQDVGEVATHTIVHQNETYNYRRGQQYVSAKDVAEQPQRRSVLTELAAHHQGAAGKSLCT